LKVRFLGTGTSQGVPVIACDCHVCKSLDEKDKRLRSSVLVEAGDLTLVIDTGPDFRQQMLKYDVTKLDAILFTHEHRDHTSGLDDIRAFNHKYDKDMPIYAERRVIDQLMIEYHYIFASNKYPGIPRVHTHEIWNKQFEIQGLEIIPIQVLHYKLPVLGFRIKNFSYITDAKTISDTEIEKLSGTEVLVINALQHEPHISHFTFVEAIEFAQRINAKQTYFTHISHKLGCHEDVNNMLPPNIRLAYDGLEIVV
jgi:phosphoribosyl 1,2-cyclic phosphate phosphodiesterase